MDKSYLGHLLVKWALKGQRKIRHIGTDGCRGLCECCFGKRIKRVVVYVKGPGQGRESAIRTIHNTGILVTEIIDVTPLPHNGCRPPKKRRV